MGRLSWATWSVMADLCCSVVDDFLMALVNFLSAFFPSSFSCSFGDQDINERGRKLKLLSTSYRICLA